MTIDKLAIQASQELPSQTDTHPSENVSVMTLQSGKELHPVEPVPVKAKGDEKTLHDTDTQNKEVESEIIPPSLSNTCALPPYRMSKLKEDEKEILNTSLKKLFEVGKKVLFYKVRLKLIPGQLSSYWLGRFEGVNVFPHGVARIKILDTEQTFKVNGHQLKPSLGGD
ncbi:UNVERIFIED_CONTAM: hypothetical protein Slati_3785800 [Sesamum latifolium]|uniref:Uncharacterized protein n=1 Tax=Sesamum latifolium TaxID=2727402 RepID=A0AAW2U8B7_9LAMI